MLNDINLIIAILTGLCILITNVWLFLRYTWSVATQLGNRDRRIEKLEQDVNNLKIVCKSMIDTKSWELQVQLTHMQEHLEGKTGYHPPSFRRD